MIEALMQIEKERAQFKSDFNSEYDRIKAEKMNELSAFNKISEEEAIKMVVEGKTVKVLNGLTIYEIVNDGRYASLMVNDEEEDYALIRNNSFDLSQFSGYEDMEFYA